MPTKTDLYAELNWITEKISSLVWTLNLGALGTTWTLLIATTNTKLQFQPAEAFPILFLCIASLTFEMLQYLSAYINDRLILHKVEAAKTDTYDYDATAFLYRLRMFFFYLKIVATIAAAVLLLWKIYTHLWLS
jgi:hypothetical protein